MSSKRVTRYVRPSLLTQYVRPPVTSYTDACEAPPSMWHGAIPLRTVVRNNTRVVEKTYTHPQEVKPVDLGFASVNTMYCVGNDDLASTFPEGLGGKVMQMMPPGHPRGFLYRKESHLLNLFIEKLSLWESKQNVLKVLTDNRPGFIVDGATGCGKSALLCQAVHMARSRQIMTLYIPNAKDWTHGEWCWPSTILPGFFDAPDAARSFLQYFARANKAALSKWTLRKTPSDLPIEKSENQPKTLFDLCEWGYIAAAPASIDRQSVAMKFLFDELEEEKKIPILFVVDGMNLFSHETHFRYPHPHFLRTIASYNEGTTDIDLYPQELPRIPASRLSLVRGLNHILLNHSANPNKYFITATTRDFKPFDGISGFADVVTDRHVNSLDEYAPYHPEKDSNLHLMNLNNFDDYEYRSFLRFLVNSGELAGFGWGPMWHYSSGFERKLYKIDFMSGRNPQRVVDHYHQELVWRYEFQRLRQKQYLLNRKQQLDTKRKERIHI